MKTQLSEFLWVSSAQNDPGTPAWHVAGIDTAETMDEAKALGNMIVPFGPLNMIQAEARGLSLETIGQMFSTELTVQNETLQTQLDSANRQVDDLTNQVAALRQQLEDAAQ